MAIFPSSAIPTAAATSFSIDNSLRLEDADSAYLNRNISGGNRKTFTISCWVKIHNESVQFYLLSGGSGGGDGAYEIIAFHNSNGLQTENGSGFNLKTGNKYRDPSAWYHLVVAFDTTQSIQANRLKMYINGEQQTITTSAGGLSLNQQMNYINNATCWIGGTPAWSAYNSDVYVAEYHFIDGTALDHTSFGEEDADYKHWKPIAYAGSYGTNGFHLDFKLSAATSSGLGNDANGSNNWTPNNLASTDQMLDSPTNNFCTWNSIDPTPEGIANTITEGNLQVRDSSGGYNWVIATQGMSSGKWYWEVYIDTTYNYQIIGVHAGTDTSRSQAHLGGESDGWGWQWYTGQFYNSDSSTTSTTATTGDIVQVAVDVDAGKIWWGKNGTWVDSGNPAAGTNEKFSGLPSFLQPAFSIYGANSTNRMTTNFGQDSSFAGGKTTGSANANDGTYGDFYYTPPTDFLALCTNNLPEPAVKPQENFNVVTYAGNGSTQSITGVGFQPDIVWAKKRNFNEGHHFYDSVRGALKVFFTNTNGIENGGYSGALSSFDSDGFSAGGDDGVNASGGNYVAWCWKGGATAASNTNGSITSSVSANPDAGFSVGTYTGNVTAGATVGHGLNSAPEILICKRRDTTSESWAMNMDNIVTDSSNDGCKLEAAIAFFNNDSIWWNSTAPGASYFTLGSHATVNASGASMAFYAFHSVDGHSKMGTYEGNGSTDGTFVYCGFQPKYVLLKGDRSTQWVINDDARSPNNVVDLGLFASLQNDEESGANFQIDYLSNGFKLRTANDAFNLSGTYVFMAFAEYPFKYSTAR